MNEHLEASVNELKRADHMIFVSLKYTRTCDVIKNIVERLMSCFDSVYDFLIEALKEKKKIGEAPTIKARKIELLKEYFKNDKTFNEYFEFYQLMKKINKADFTRRQEFRRHVTMTVILEEEGCIELNIDSIHEYYTKTKAFLDWAVEMVSPREV
ncbi:hypothetical protein JXB27_03375 [Candidatus Woesearchaeota archaeon]|nr:hypothetical protein [Candidatus Woesearchaeota archaeon]